MIQTCGTDLGFCRPVVVLVEKRVSYMIFFLGKKCLVSLATAVSKSLSSPVLVSVSKIVSTSGAAKYNNRALRQVVSLMSIATMNRLNRSIQSFQRVLSEVGSECGSKRAMPKKSKPVAILITKM